MHRTGGVSVALAPDAPLPRAGRLIFFDLIDPTEKIFETTQFRDLADGSREAVFVDVPPDAFEGDGSLWKLEIEPQDVVLDRIRKTFNLLRGLISLMSQATITCDGGGFPTAFIRGLGRRKIARWSGPDSLLSGGGGFLAICWTSIKRRPVPTADLLP